jgi:hypothetical protein
VGRNRDRAQVLAPIVAHRRRHGAVRLVGHLIVCWRRSVPSPIPPFLNRRAPDGPELAVIVALLIQARSALVVGSADVLIGADRPSRTGSSL